MSGVSLKEWDEEEFEDELPNNGSQRPSSSITTKIN